MANILSTEDSGFEGGTTGGYTVDATAIVNSTEQAFAGTHSLKINPTGPAPGVMTGHATCSPSTSYTATAKLFQAVTAGATANLRIFWWDASDAFLGLDTGANFTTTVGGWVSATPLTATSPAGAAKASVNVQVVAGAGNYTYLDSVSLDGGTPPDTTAPTVVSRVVNGSTLVITYNEALDTGFTPLTSAYTVKVNTVTRSVTNVAVSGSTVTLTLASPVTAGQTVTVSYVP